MVSHLRLDILLQAHKVSPGVVQLAPRRLGALMSFCLYCCSVCHCTCPSVPGQSLPNRAIKTHNYTTALTGMDF